MQGCGLYAVCRQQLRILVGELGRRPWPSFKPCFHTRGPHRARRRAAVGRAQFGDFPALAREDKGRDDGRNVLVETFAHLVGGKIAARSKQGNADGGDDFAGPRARSCGNR